MTTVPPALFLFGEAGIGKSTALRAAADKHDGPVFRVACQRVAREIPFDPLLALLQRVLRHTDSNAVLRRTSEKDLILELQPAIARCTIAATPLVQIDDLHWADDATLEAVPYLVERLQDFPVRWQFAARVGYDGVTAVYHRLRQAGLATADTLGPLSNESIAAIIDASSDRLDAEERAAVIALAGGNPLYAQLLARASSLRASSVARAARDHVADLSEAALAVASALAVLERPLDTETLSEVTAMAPRAVTNAVDVLLARGLVELRENLATIRHQLLGDAVLDQLSPHVITRIHAGAARIVTDPEQRARHLLAAGESGAARACFARLGWDALDAEEWEMAIRSFAEAIALESPDVPLPLEQSESVGAALRLVRRIAGNEPAQSMVYDETWSRLAPPVRARLELARIKARLFESPSFDAAERDRIALLAGENIEPAIAAELFYQCFRAARYRLEHDAAKALIQKLRGLVPSLTATASRVKALARCAMVAAIYDDWALGIAEFDDAIRAGAAAHAYDAVLEVVLPVMNTMASVGRFDESTAFGRFAMELPGGSLRNKTALAPDYALALYGAGRAKEALSVITTAAGAVPVLGLHEREIFIAQQITLDTKLGLAEHARSLIADCGDAQGAGAFLQLAIGTFYEQHGDPEEARRALEADFESPVRAHPANLRYVLLALARIALRTSGTALMERTLRRLRKFRGTGEVNDACVAWGEAYAMIMENKKDSALSFLREAAGAPLPIIETARVYFEIAKLTGRTEDFTESLERFKSVDCLYMVERVQAAASEMGVTFGKPRTTNSATKLTDRQRTIALMISSGKTNAEIATALKISKRTADHHVDHIRDKLGVRSRVEIAVAVANGAAFD